MFSEVDVQMVNKFSELTLLKKKKLRIIKKKYITQPIDNIISEPELDKIVDKVNNLTIVNEVLNTNSILNNKIKIIFVCIPHRNRNPKYKYNLFNCQVLLKKDYQLPILEFEVTNDFKYKKFIREECRRIYNILSSDIIDIKLYSSENHTYCVFLKSMSHYSNIDSLSNIHNEYQLYRKTIYILCEMLNDNDYKKETEYMFSSQKDYIFENSPKISTFSLIKKFQELH